MIFNKLLTFLTFFDLKIYFKEIFRYILDNISLLYYTIIALKDFIPERRYLNELFARS